MKRIILIPAAAGVLAFGGFVLANTDSNADPAPAGTNTQEANTVTASPVTQASQEMIGTEKAAAIALAIADGEVTNLELSEDDGRQEYEVEVHTPEYEYDFDIDAFTGEVREQDRERLRDDDRTSGQPATEAAGTAQAAVSADEAKEIALKETGGGTITDFELDSDDGRQYYEIEIVNGSTEFEMEINAADGSVIEFEQDDEDDR